MDLKQFTERVHFVETLSLFFEEELNTFSRFAVGALLISNLDTKETILKEDAKKLICLDPWIFYLYQQLFNNVKFSLLIKLIENIRCTYYSFASVNDETL